MRTNADRLAALRRLLILDSSPERAYDDITRLLSDGLGVPITMVNLLDERRDWFKSRVGLPFSESSVEHSFCQSLLDTGERVIIVPDTTLDPRFADNAFVREAPHIRFYATAALVVEDQVVGTLCAYDVRPRTLSAAQIDALGALAAAATDLLAARLRSVAPP